MAEVDVVELRMSASQQRMRRFAAAEPIDWSGR
jgi:hypothetical protein